MRPQGPSRKALITAAVGVAALFTAAPAGAFAVAPLAPVVVRPSGAEVDAVFRADPLGAPALLHRVRYDRPQWRDDKFEHGHGSFERNDDGFDRLQRRDGKFGRSDDRFGEDDESFGLGPKPHLRPKIKRIRLVVQRKVCNRLDRISDKFGHDFPLPRFCVSPH